MSTPTVEIPEFRSTAERGGIELSLAGTARELIGSELFTLTSRTNRTAAATFSALQPEAGIGKSKYTCHPDRQRDTHNPRPQARRRRMAGDGPGAITIDGLDDVLCGTWHSHPDTRDTVPSDPDLSDERGARTEARARPKLRIRRQPHLRRIGISG